MENKQETINTTEKKDDFEEQKINEKIHNTHSTNTIYSSANILNSHNQQHHLSHHISNNNLSSFNSNNLLSMNDHELLFMTTQLAPIMDRCGRLLSGINIFNYFYRSFITPFTFDSKPQSIPSAFIRV